jgi:hypothetical protein
MRAASGEVSRNLTKSKFVVDPVVKLAQNPLTL